MDIQNWLFTNKECIVKVIELEDVISKSDPCEQPYKSQYAARDILQTCISSLDEWMKEDITRCNYLAYFIYFNLSYRLANNFISTEERYAGEEIIFSLSKTIGKIPEISLYLKQLSDKSTTNDTANVTDPSNNKSTELYDKDSIIWISWLSGIILKINNACGLLSAGKIINLGPLDTSSGNDMDYDNSLKYLSTSKRLYKTYKLLKKMKDKTPMESHTEITLNYEAPESFDSLLLNTFRYETPYLHNECYLMEGVTKKEALNFDIFESDYTTTLFLLAQTYGKMSTESSMKHKSAKYCYWTLYRQLNALKYDPVEWSLNAATLSQYYVVEGVFKRAKHCIAAAQIILKEAINRPTPGPKEESKKSKNGKEDNVLDVNLKKVSEQSDISNDEKDVNTKDKNDVECGSLLGGDCHKTIDGILEESINAVVDQMERNKILKENSSKITTNNESIISESTKPDYNGDLKDNNIKSRRLIPDPMSESRLWDDDVYEEKRVQGEADIDRCWVSYGLNLLEMSFDRQMPDYHGPTEMDKFLIESKLPDFNLELAAIEREVTHEWTHSFEEARELFLFIQKKINIARQYYRLDFRCSDAIDLICDHSKAFKAISNFEISTDRKCIMHKKRIDMLTNLLKTLNQRYYQLPCRKMMLEVGEIYSTMMNLKLSLLETTSGPNDSIKLPDNAKGIVQKIRLLSKKGINTYEDFLESYRNPNGIMPEVFTEEDIRPILIAHFYMARIYSKILEPETMGRLKNLVKSLEHYQYIVDYCNKHDNASKQMVAELESCKDMVILLPRKIDKLRSEG